MPAFSTDEDLLRIRPSVLDHGIDDLAALHEEAHDLIVELLEAQWYPARAEDEGINPDVTPFDETRLTTTRLRRAACYKVLELLYGQLAKATPEPDGFERLSTKYEKKFDTEFQRIMSIGLDYDWNQGGAVAQDERFRSRLRRLRRC